MKCSISSEVCSLSYRLSAINAAGVGISLSGGEAQDKHLVLLGVRSTRLLRVDDTSWRSIFYYLVVDRWGEGVGRGGSISRVFDTIVSAVPILHSASLA